MRVIVNIFVIYLERVVIWSTIRRPISIDNLSNLDSPKNFASSSYNLSPPVQNLAIIIPKRSYSTSPPRRQSRHVLRTAQDIDNNEFIKFDSLESACEQIKFKYIGVSLKKSCLWTSAAATTQRVRVGGSLRECNQIRYFHTNPRSLKEILAKSETLTVSQKIVSSNKFF
jgi:hypothetical protein